MKKTQPEVVVLKIGGSVVTYKSNDQVRVRKARLREIALEIKLAQKKLPDTKLILVHGAGSAGHQLANKFKLKEGVAGDMKKLTAALKIRENNQFLNLEIGKIFTAAGLSVVTVHSGSNVLQLNGELNYVDTKLIEIAMSQGCIPVMYGEMVFDEVLGLSVCSGDNLATYLAQTFSARKIIYASDIDGIYDADPYVNKKAQLLTTSNIEDLVPSSGVTIGSSHHIDVTGGLANKINLIKQGLGGEKLRQLVVFNGLKKGGFKNVLSEDFADCSVVEIKK
jgi:isopentenyl phosphate kinase